MSKAKPIDLGLKHVDELFMDDTERAELKLPRIHDIPLDQIDDFPDHPFKVREDEDMEQLVQSVRERGIITPITVRPKGDGRYEIVSGHRRKKACELAGLETVKAEIKEMSRDEATILMVDSNLQRTNILPSEKARSYWMKLEAMKRQVGRPCADNGVPVGHHLSGKSREILAAESPDSNTQIQRYLRLMELIPPLLEMVDQNRIAMRPAVEISYLTKEEQQNLNETISYEECTPSLAQAIKMREFSKNGKLNGDVILSIMSEQKPNQHEKISFRADKLRQFIPNSVPPNKTEEYVFKALDYYRRVQERMRDNSMER